MQMKMTTIFLSTRANGTEDFPFLLACKIRLASGMPISSDGIREAMSRCADIKQGNIWGIKVGNFEIESRGISGHGMAQYIISWPESEKDEME